MSVPYSAVHERLFSNLILDFLEKGTPKAFTGREITEGVAEADESIGEVGPRQIRTEHGVIEYASLAHDFPTVLEHLTERNKIEKLRLAPSGDDQAYFRFVD
jgi:hypothetical protein